MEHMEIYVGLLITMFLSVMSYLLKRQIDSTDAQLVEYHGNFERIKDYRNLIDQRVLQLEIQLAQVIKNHEEIKIIIHTLNLHNDKILEMELNLQHHISNDNSVSFNYNEILNNIMRKLEEKHDS